MESLENKLGDISPVEFKECYENNSLGRVYIDHPVSGKVSADLNEIYDATKGIDLVSVNVLGSVLYKHFPHEKSKYEKTGRLLDLVKAYFKPDEGINDFDVAVIANNIQKEEQMRRPLTSNSHYDNTTFNVFPNRAMQVSSSRDSYGGFINVYGALNLHIIYMGKHDFIDGLGNNTVANSVHNYSVPIVGRGNFNELIKGLSDRKPLHAPQWRESEGVWNCYIQ